MINQILGTLYGMAIGDAMGMPSELWSRQKVKIFFGNIHTFLDGPSENEVAYQYKKGQFTDDTAQALLVLDSLIAKNFHFEPDDFVERLLNWAKEEKAFEKNILGPSSKAALLGIQAGDDVTKITNQAQTNGSAMRIAPIGCLFHPTQKAELIKFVSQISKVTHSSDVTLAGACMVAAAVSGAMAYDNFDHILEFVYSTEAPARELGFETINPSLSMRTRLGIELAKQHAGDDENFLESIYQTIGCGVLMSESVPAALSIAYYAKDVEHCSLLCANLGGDTDTIGAMACAIRGAYEGYSSIRSELIEEINQSNSVNFIRYANHLNEARGTLI